MPESRSHCEQLQRAKVGPDLEVSPLDTRSYRSLTLSNQLHALIISDHISDKAAASLDVSVGSFSDPNDIPGLAHFLEHMLFLGTEKYPDEGSYNEFLAENGGHSNAFTASENTNYHFNLLVSDRDPDHPSPRFKEALDRFAQFFISPLFSESATERELNAVHSEHQKNLQSDSRRLNQVMHSCANPKHPFSKFGTGSRETLNDIPRKSGIDVRAQLLKFHREYYSANLMNLCIVGPYPLDMLQEWVVELFSEIPNHDRKHPSEEYRNIKPVLEEHRGLLYHIESVHDIRLLEITWFTETYVHNYRSKPARLVSLMLGDEGEGSLLSLLKNQGWCDGVSASPGEMNTFGYLQMTITLTNKGVDHVDDIVKMVFQYIQMLKLDGIPKRIFDEEACLGEISFRFHEREEPLTLVTRLALKMAYFSQPEYISGHFLYKTFDENKVREVLDALTADNCNLTISGRFVSGKTDQNEKWYGTPYKVEQINNARMKQWTNCDNDKALHLPPENLFIPTDFDLLGQPLPEGEYDRAGPIIIERNEHFELYHKLDRTFKRPRTKIIIQLLTPMTYASPWHAVMAKIFTLLLEDSLSEFSYPADRAGCQYSFDKSETGLELIISGYSHRIDVLLNAVIQKVRTLEVDATRFEMQRDIVEREFVNFEKGQPLHNAIYYLLHLVEDPRWHVRDYLQCLQNGEITLESMRKYAKDILQRLWMTALVCGNTSESDAIKMMKGVRENLGYKPLPEAEVLSRRIVQVPNGRNVFLRTKHCNEDDKNSAIKVYFQFGMRGDFNRDVQEELLSEILDKPAFHELRTVQQLGYMVFEGLATYEGVRGIFFIIQSTVADPDVLLERIEQFLKDVRKDVLEEMAEEKFQDYVNALIAKKSEPDRSISRQTNRFWREIERGFLQFDRKEKEIEALKSVTKQQVVQLFDEALADGGSRCRRVVCQIYGNQHPFEKRKELNEGIWDVNNPLDFRRRCSLFPVVGRPCGTSRNG